MILSSSRYIIYTTTTSACKCNDDNFQIKKLYERIQENFVSKAVRMNENDEAVSNINLAYLKNIPLFFFTLLSYILIHNPFFLLN